ncbi:MAG: hypothetical protein CM15mP58_05850 [Burkholderiaceae bacterium]|nr:MAG: hypothetical protein CM15mP58_05850 [Burkholderiaceae bacterium]
MTESKFFWAKRNGKDAWQFPQGGIKKGESIELAMYRELKEETGIGNADVEILGRTKTWHYYDVSKEFNKKGKSFFLQGPTTNLVPLAF